MTDLTQTSDRPTVEIARRSIKVQFRDENYGSIYGAVAFRFGSTVHLEDHEIEDLHAAAESVGFSFNHQRCAWIREFVYEASAEAKQALETAVGRAGFHLTGK